MFALVAYLNLLAELMVTCEKIYAPIGTTVAVFVVPQVDVDTRHLSY